MVPKIAPNNDQTRNAKLLLQQNGKFAFMLICAAVPEHLRSPTILIN
jgi:hypothetical protein